MAQVEQPLEIAQRALEVLFYLPAKDRIAAIELLPHLAAQKLIGRHPLRLAVEVVERQINRRGEVEVGYGAVEGVAAQQLVDLGNSSGVPPHQQFVVLPGNGRQIFGAAVGRLAPADRAVIDKDLDQHVPGDVAVVARGLYLHGFYFGNFHA